MWLCGSIFQVYLAASIQCTAHDLQRQKTPGEYKYSSALFKETGKEE
jgi:hypothetical protein